MENQFCILENFFVNQNFFHSDSYADVEFPKKPSFQLLSKNFIQNFLTPLQSLSVVDMTFNVQTSNNLNFEMLIYSLKENNFLHLDQYF
jgi:hypothetical protein